MFIVKGVNVFPLAIQATLLRLQPRITGEFRVVLDRKPPIDYPVPILVEVSPDLPEASHAELRRELAAQLQRELNFTSSIELVTSGTLASEKKTRRVVRTYRGEKLDG